MKQWRNAQPGASRFPACTRQDLASPRSGDQTEVLHGGEVTGQAWGSASGCCPSLAGPSPFSQASAPRTNVGREPGRALFISKFRVWNSDWPIYYASPAWDTEIQDQSDWVPALVELTVRNGEERNRHKQKDFQASTCYNGRAGGRLGSGRKGSAQAGQVMSGGCPWQACSLALPARYLESHNHLHRRNWPHFTGEELGDLPKDTELANAGARFELRAS